jgi:HPt (histidine-containing phosphotransfer) domain-containing protein
MLSNPRFARALGRDAKKAIVDLNEATEKKDTERFRATFHAMKSALAGVGESESAALSFELEKAGTNGDIDFIMAHVTAYIEMLEGFVINASENTEAEKTREDTAFVRSQLEVIKEACDNYDVRATELAFEALLEKTPNNKTHEFVEKVHDLLYSDSDFDGVAEKIIEFLREYK